MRSFVCTVSYGFLAAATLGSADVGVNAEVSGEDFDPSKEVADINDMVSDEADISPRVSWSSWARRRRRRRFSANHLDNLGDAGCSRRRNGYCAACKGDCDSDADCSGNLKCFQRDGKTPVPGCIGGYGGDVWSTDYCYNPPKVTKRGKGDAGVCTAGGQKRCKDTCGYRGKSYEWCYTVGGSWDYCGSSKCVGDPSITCRNIDGSGFQWCTSHGTSTSWEKCCHDSPPRPTPSCVKGKTDEAHVYVVAHMTNTIRAVDWAVRLGANAVEADLQLYTEPWQFFHNNWGGGCDCSCNWAPSWKHVCSQGNVCIERTSATKLLNHMATKDLAMVFIDPKVPDAPNYYRSKADKAAIGIKLAKMLVKDLFKYDKGRYPGIAVVGGYSMVDIDMLDAMAKHIKTTKYEGRVYYTIGMERRYDVKTVSEALSNISPYTLFSDGLTACMPGDWKHEMRMGEEQWKKGVLAMPPLIWTIDKVKSMKSYLDSGARSLLTNMPTNALKAIRAKGLTLAKPSYRPGAARCPV